MASPQPIPVADYPQPLLCPFIATVEDKAVGFEHGCRTEVILVIPVRRAGRGAGTTQDAGHCLIEELSVFGALKPLPRSTRGMCNQIGLDDGYLLKEGVHIDNQVFDYGEAPQRLYDDGLPLQGENLAIASQSVHPVNGHSAGTTYGAPAGPSISKGAIQSPLDLVQSIKYCHPGLDFHGIFSVIGFFILIRVKPQYLEGYLHGLLPP